RKRLQRLGARRRDPLDRSVQLRDGHVPIGEVSASHRGLCRRKGAVVLRPARGQMNWLAKAFWALPAVGLLLASAAFSASCDIHGVTPNCSADGGDCVTPAGDAYPSPDAGTE